jgi:hypothetical protein
MMHGRGKSDSAIVAGKSAYKAERTFSILCFPIAATADAVIALLKNSLRACVAGRGVSYRGVLRLPLPRSNRLEKLKGDLKDFHSIRINAQWRVIFKCFMESLKSKFGSWIIIERRRRWLGTNLHRLRQAKC